MATDKKLLEFIVKLTRLTIEGEVTWKADNDTSQITVGTNNIVPILYIITFKDIRFGIYQIRYIEDFDPDYSHPRWSERIVLAKLDAQNRVTWDTKGQISALRNLFEAVRSQASGIDSFIDELLADDNSYINKKGPLTHSQGAVSNS